MTAPPALHSDVRSSGFPPLTLPNFPPAPPGAPVFPPLLPLPGGQVLVSTALSGGTLIWRLEQVIRRYGLEHVLPGLDPIAMLFPLPAPDGVGRPLSHTDLRQLLDRERPTVHSSDALYAHYFLYQDETGQPRFVLFDSPVSLRQKLTLLRTLGLSVAVAPYARVRDWLGEIRSWEELLS